MNGATSHVGILYTEKLKSKELLGEMGAWLAAPFIVNISCKVGDTPEFLPFSQFWPYLSSPYTYLATKNMKKT